jgi:cobalamin-dependent methionine synthase I
MTCARCFLNINETALFKNQWQLKTASQADYVRLVEEKFRPIKKKLEEEVAESDLFEPKVVYGYFPCQSDGNDVLIYEPDGEGRDAPATAGGRPALLNSCGLLFLGSARGGGFVFRTFSLPRLPGRWM